ncbi:hypothetical protein [Methylorubrum extorquens]
MDDNRPSKSLILKINISSPIQSIIGATLKRHPLSSFSFSAGVDTCALFRFDAGPLRAIREDRRLGGSIEGVRASA